MKTYSFFFTMALAGLSGLVAFLSNAQLEYFASPVYLSYLTGGFVFWLFYVALNYTVGVGRNKSLDEKWSGAALAFIPVFFISYLTSAFGFHHEFFAYRVAIGLIANFCIGGGFLLVADYLVHSENIQAIDNPFNLICRAVQREGDSWVDYRESSGADMYLSCKADAAVTVAVLISNEKGAPYCPFPMMKCNSVEDVLYLAGEPFKLKVDHLNQLSVWVVASKEKSQIVDLIAENELDWPSENTPNFRQFSFIGDLPN